MKIPFGPKHAAQAATWIPTLSAFGAGGALTLFYFSEWKAVVTYIPFYGGKFSNTDEE